MLMSAPLEHITVIQMLSAQTRMDRLHALANQALLAPELFVMVSKDPSANLIINIFMLSLNYNFLLYTCRCRRVYC